MASIVSTLFRIMLGRPLGFVLGPLGRLWTSGVHGFYRGLSASDDTQISGRINTSNLGTGELLSSFDGVRHKLSDSELLEQVHVLLLKIGDEYYIYTIRLRDQATHFDRIDMLSHLRLESGTPRDEAALYRYCEDNIARLDGVPCPVIHWRSTCPHATSESYYFCDYRSQCSFIKAWLDCHKSVQMTHARYNIAIMRLVSSLIATGSLDDSGLQRFGGLDIKLNYSSSLAVEWTGWIRSGTVSTVRAMIVTINDIPYVVLLERPFPGNPATINEVRIARRTEIVPSMVLHCGEYPRDGYQVQWGPLCQTPGICDIVVFPPVDDAQADYWRFVHMVVRCRQYAEEGIARKHRIMRELADTVSYRLYSSS